MTSDVASDHPHVHNRHPSFLETRAAEQHDSHQAADDRAANEGGGHIPVLDADFPAVRHARAPVANASRRYLATRRKQLQNSLSEIANLLRLRATQQGIFKGAAILMARQHQHAQAADT